MNSKAKITAYGHINKLGALKIINAKDFIQMVKNLFPKGQFQITVQKRRKNRSNAQNSYYWAVIVPLVRDGLKDAGNMDVSNEIAHEFMKMKFLEKRKVFDRSGEVTELPSTTTTLTTSEMMDYFAEIQTWAAIHLDIKIPDPNEQIQLEFE